MACVQRRRGRWVVDFRDQDGKRHWQTYRPRDEADTALSKLTPAVREGTYRPPAELPTLATVARDWFATKAGHRVSSQAGWQVHLDVHIVPALGTRRIDQIGVGHHVRRRRSRLSRCWEHSGSRIRQGLARWNGPLALVLQGFRNVVAEW
jgi:hypothetical protein